MCGITGFLGRFGSAGQNAAVAQRMAGLIKHRGPDDNGAWEDAEAGIAMAQRRLAVLDLSAAGHQPMLSSCGRYVIVLNGEIYNYLEIRRQLDTEATHPWRGRSDTEVLLEAVARWGLKTTLQRCTGMFAFALWDRRERSLVLARDRLGEKPLYYGYIGTTFAFASEIKAFRGHPGWKPEIDRASVTLLMRYNYVPAPYSIYKGIYKLRPGHFLVVTENVRAPNIESYWSPRDAVEGNHLFKGSRDDAVSTLDSLLRQSIKGQMIADVPVGAFLSGGVDSSTVVALMQSMSTRPVRTFTIGFDQADYNEARYAREIAGRLGTDHSELYVTEREAMDIVPALPEMYCEPFADSSQIPTYLVSRLARQDVTVSLSGDGGDELFSGYARYRLADDFWKTVSRIPRSLRRAAAGLAMLPSPALYDRLASPLMPLMPDHRRFHQVGDQVHKVAQFLPLRTLDDVYRRLCSHWNNPAEIVVGGFEPPTMLTGLEALPALRGNVERMMYIDLASYLPDDILVKIDRAAMAASLETRVPMLDHRIVEFALSLPLAILRAENKPKWPLRQILHRYVPAELVDRPKMGFGAPIGHWLRGALRDWAEDLLSERSLQGDGLLQPKPIRRAWQEHLSGRRNHQFPLWNVLMFQAWRSAQQRHQSALAA